MSTIAYKEDSFRKIFYETIFESKAFLLMFCLISPQGWHTPNFQAAAAFPAPPPPLFDINLPWQISFFNSNTLNLLSLHSQFYYFTLERWQFRRKIQFYWGGLCVFFSILNVFGRRKSEMLFGKDVDVINSQYTPLYPVLFTYLVSILFAFMQIGSVLL